MSEAPILIVGAGPTGLVLALGLAARNVPFRLIDAAAGPGERSRATTVHARTLEFYAQFGFADEVVGEGIPSDAIRLRQRNAKGRSRTVLSADLSDLGGDLSPFPFVLNYPQDLHERLLGRRLRAQGGAIEWNTRLDDLVPDETGATATLVRPDGTRDTQRFAYVCGCDGAHSRVRGALKLDFSGGTYEQPFYVADVRLADGVAQRDLTMNLGPRILALMMPVRLTGMVRLIGLVPPELAEVEPLGFEAMQGEIEDLIGIRIAEVNWFSRYRVHHRVASHLRGGRVFLLGDAGHIHSPVGGQGMNTGIGDAINLGWKLASVWSGKAGAAILDSYEPERLAFARALVSTTDRLFSAIIARGPTGELIRRGLAPLIGRIAERLAPARRRLFRTISQIGIAYRASPISEGRAGGIGGGDRLPWAGGTGVDNFAPLRSLDWQVHVYGALNPRLEAAASARGLPVHVFAFGEGAQRAGLGQDAAYLVRPDGYVGLAIPDQDGAALERYYEAIGLLGPFGQVQRLDSAA